MRQIIANFLRKLIKLDDYIEDRVFTEIDELKDLVESELNDKKEDFEEEWTTSIAIKDKYESVRADNEDYFVQEGEE